MKSSSLVVRLTVLYLVAALFMFVLLNTVGVKRMRETLTENKKTELYEKADLLVSEYLTKYYRQEVSFPELSDRLEITASVTGIRIWMVGVTGFVVFDSGEVAHGENVTKEDASFLEHTFLEDAQIKDWIQEPSLCVIQPIIYEYATRGYLVLLVPMRELSEEGTFYVDFVNICYLLFLPLLLLLFVRIYMLTVRPVTRMTEAARDFLRGNFKEPLTLNYPEEYNELGNTVQYMGDKLRNADDAQRKFVSNVSHDFRSPLTSIKGYVEAIEDGTIPAEMQGKYLDVVLFETERLEKLTSNLLELNSFDDAGISLHKSAFDINQMIKQIALTFEGMCTKKKLVLNLVFSAKEEFVEADMDKIQQVLYNLIDNAVKFSGSESSIRIATEERGMKVFIAVKDYGIGIPKDSIGRIWERFYKTDLSRGKDKKGIGLGLSIVKEIITSHGENISVVSTEGVGTEFVFSLPKAEEE